MAAVLLCAAAVAACSSGSSGGSSTSSAAAAATTGPQNTAVPQPGGNFTMLEETGLTGAWPTGLDPATDASGSANQSYLDAIYGNLFELGANGQTIDDLATGYTISANDKAVTIELRHGVTFTDGTPFKYRLTTRYEIPCTVSGTVTVGDTSSARSPRLRTCVSTCSG